VGFVVSCTDLEGVGSVGLDTVLEGFGSVGLDSVLEKVNSGGLEAGAAGNVLLGAVIDFFVDLLNILSSKSSIS